MKIIVVDNDPVMLKFVSDVLRREGHDVETATSGVAALDLVRGGPPDMMFVDYVMPNIDGRTLCQMVRDMPGVSGVTIAVLSAVAAEEWSDIHEIGADIYIAKGPLDKMSDLLKWVVSNPEAAAAACAQGDVIGLENVFARGITKELLQTKEHFELILSRMSEGIVEIDRKGRVVFANPSALAILSRTAADLLGEPFLDLFPQEHRARLSPWFRAGRVEAKKLGDRQPLEVGGRKITLELLPLEEEADSSGALAIFSDISESVRMARELGRTNAFLTQILNSSESVSIVTTDLEGNIRFWNQGAENIFGYPVTEMIGKANIDLLYPGKKQLDQARRLRERICKTGKGTQTELREIDRQGRLRTIRLNLSPVVGDDGQVIGIQGIGEDITDWKKAEKALRESEEKFRVIVESAEDGIFIKGEDSCFSLVNPALAKMLGTAPAEAIGKTEQGLFGLEDGADISHEDRRVLDGGVVERNLKVKVNGVSRHLHVIKVPLRDAAGNVSAICGVLRDLTKLRELEAQSRQKFKMEALGTLAGGIAHDFNNLLAVINGFSEIALNDLKKSLPVEDHLHYIHNAGMRAGELVRQILMFVQKGDTEPKPVDLKTLVEESLSFLRASLPATVSIESDLADHAILMADPIQLQQVILNLCANASQAMTESGGVVRVALKEIDSAESDGWPQDKKSDPLLMLTVSDTGPGISPDVFDCIFDPYFTTKEKGKGTGMGLAVAKGIVEGLGGKISAENRPAGGARFSVLLPVEQRREAQGKADPNPMSRGSESILFVDDQAQVAAVADRMLSHLGYKVTRTTDPEEALRQIEQNPDAYELVISDLTMPGLTGDRLSAKLKKINPGLPVILCTGFKDKAGEGIEQTMGVDGFLMKPFTMDALARKVRKALDDRSRT